MQQFTPSSDEELVYLSSNSRAGVFQKSTCTISTCGNFDEQKIEVTFINYSQCPIETSPSRVTDFRSRQHIEAKQIPSSGPRVSSISESGVAFVWQTGGVVFRPADPDPNGPEFEFQIFPIGDDTNPVGNAKLFGEGALNTIRSALEYLISSGATDQQLSEVVANGQAMFAITNSNSIVYFTSRSGITSVGTRNTVETLDVRVLAREACLKLQSNPVGIQSLVVDLYENYPNMKRLDDECS